ncbi:MAG: ABC transporter ATP-binding protein [Sphingobacteriaceae bacterium]|nr:ABC transporter ATP-binding protein [Sphingobacteriaceae bacterium]
MSEEKKNKFSLALLRRILSYTKPYKRFFFISLTLTLVLSGFAIVRPLLINKVLNNFVDDSSDLSGLNTIGILILASLLFEAVLQFANIYVTNFLGQSIVKDLRNQVYKHIIHLKNSYFDKTPVGMLVTRAISDIEALSEVFSEGFIVISGDILMLLTFVTVMFIKNWVLTLIVLTTIPLLLVATTLFKNGVKKTFNEVRNAVSSLNTFTQEHLTGMRIIQLFNREEQEYEKFTVINDKHRKANIRSIWYYSIFFPVVEILSAISIGSLIWFIGARYNSSGIGLGDITFFVMMVNMLFRPIRMLADRLNTLQMGIVSADRVFKVLDTNEIIEDKGTKTFEGVNGNIEFKNVWFAYNDENYVLKDVSFSINAGQTVALVGATGAGKSTIINLLSRFYDLNKGEICVDGVNINNYKLEELRKNTGVVLQDVHLFNDSIFNNITLHNPDITLEKVIDASMQIGLHDFVMSLPGGYDYVVKERGITLSAGQRQLIAFIRAFVYNPKLFILDEATATIDTHTEQLLQKALDKISKGRTSIVIAHRLATIKDANKIIVFEKGQIVEQGSQAELLNMNGQFKRLYDLQFEEIV